MVPMDRDMGKLAPSFRLRIEAVVADLEAEGFTPWVVECVRTAERQAWLYAQGRTRPGSIVTKAPTHVSSWHGHGLAVDIIDRVKHWGATQAFWQSLGAACGRHGVTWGGNWKSFPDRPHCQDGRVPGGPSKVDRDRTLGSGMAATWEAYNL